MSIQMNNYINKHSKFANRFWEKIDFLKRPINEAKKTK